MQAVDALLIFTCGVFNCEMSMLPTSVCAFDIHAATTAFREVFPVIDGSIIDSIPQSTITRVLDSAIVTNFNVSCEADVKSADTFLIQRILMFAALGLLANELSGGDPWAKVLYSPSTESLEYVPGATATRQLFADVIVVLSVLALGRVWLHTRLLGADEARVVSKAT
jgi:hypothetical protein